MKISIRGYLIFNGYFAAFLTAGKFVISFYHHLTGGRH